MFGYKQEDFQSFQVSSIKGSVKHETHETVLYLVALGFIMVSNMGIYTVFTTKANLKVVCPGLGINLTPRL